VSVSLVFFARKERIDIHGCAAEPPTAHFRHAPTPVVWLSVREGNACWRRRWASRSMLVCSIPDTLAISPLADEWWWANPAKPPSRRYR